MQASAHAIPHPGVHEAHADELGFWSKYVFSTDHKIIGIQYGVTALFFLLFGFCLMLMMRWQIAHTNQPVPVIGPVLASLLGAVNYIATIIQLRAPGMTWMRLPFFVWAQFVTAFLLLLAFPPLEAAGIMQLMDKVAHTSFFLPTGLAIGGNLANISGGGSPLLWQHLFWFLGHPEVYVLILPAMGIVAEVIANNTL